MGPLVANFSEENICVLHIADKQNKGRPSKIVYR